MINKKLIEKYIKYCIVLLFTANLYSTEGDIAKNITHISFSQQYYDITRPLNQLIRDGRYDDFMNTIIQSQIHVNFIDESGQTPLILACIANNLELVKFILTNGGIIDFIDLNGKSALCYAQENANNEIINLLIENNKNSKIYDSKVDKRYECEVKDCSYTTNNKLCFKAHISAHESESQYKCNIEGGCGYIAANQSNFNPNMQYSHHSMEGANSGNIAENITRPLNQLIRDGRYDDFMNIIIQDEIHVNFIDEFGQTPLILACIANNLELVKFIIINGGIIDVIDLNGKSALCYAQENANNEIINLLIENNKNSKIYDSKADKRYKCEVKDCPYTTNNESYFKAHISVHKRERQYKCNVEGCGYISIRKDSLDSHIRHRHSQIDIDYKCKIEGCSYRTNDIINFKAHTSAHESESQYKCNIEGCRYIAANQSNFNPHMQYSHHSMEGANSDDIAENITHISFLQHYYNITRPLNQLIRDGRYDDFMNTIIQDEIHVNFIDESGQTPLILACIANNLELVKFILTNGGIIDFIDPNGKSALCYAQENANNEIINLLIENNKNSKIYDSKVDKCYKCEVKDCPYTTNYESYFKIHTLAHNSKNCYKCNVEGCGYISINKSNLDSHTQHHYPKVDVSYKHYKCKIESCPYTTNNKSYFKAHISAHNSKNCHKCNVEGCGYISIKKDNLDSHIQHHYSDVDASYKCKIEGCPYRTNSIINFKAHISVHERERQYKCNVEGCGYISIKKNKLDSHIRRRHPQIDIGYKCKIEGCLYKTNNILHFKIHMSAHESESQYKCNIEGCRYIAVNKYSLKSHMQRNHPEANKCYKCEVKDCPYITNREFYFKAHILAHNSKNCHKCNVEGCGYISTRKASLDSHIRHSHPRIYTQIDIGYKCKIEGCPYRTNSIVNFKAHISAHKSESQYKCNIEGCGYISIRKDNLDSHIRHSHPENDDNARNKSSFSKDKLFKCTKCKFESTSKRKLDFHVLSHNPVSKKIKKDYNKDKPK